jgi:hypothetical protein
MTTTTPTPIDPDTLTAAEQAFIVHHRAGDLFYDQVVSLVELIDVIHEVPPDIAIRLATCLDELVRVTWAATRGQQITDEQLTAVERAVSAIRTAAET